MALKITENELDGKSVMWKFPTFNRKCIKCICRNCKNEFTTNCEFSTPDFCNECELKHKELIQQINEDIIKLLDFEQKKDTHCGWSYNLSDGRWIWISLDARMHDKEKSYWELENEKLLDENHKLLNQLYEIKKVIK